MSHVLRAYAVRFIRGMLGISALHIILVQHDCFAGVLLKVREMRLSSKLHLNGMQSLPDTK